MHLIFPNLFNISHKNKLKQNEMCIVIDEHKMS